MRKIVIILSVLALIASSCGQSNTKKQTTVIDTLAFSVENVDNLSTHTENSELSEIWAILCQKYQGIWGDYNYLDTLTKYNSVWQANKIFANTFIEIQIKKDEILTDTPFGMEAYSIDKEKYNIEIENDKSFLLFNKKTGTTQKFTKIPYKEGVDAKPEPYFFKFAIDKMKYIWFCGIYDMFDEADNHIGQLEFDKYGQLKNYDGGQTRYSLESYVEGQNYLYLSTVPDDYKRREYLLMERKKTEYLFFSVKDFDWDDEPLVKTNFKFKLRKIE